MVSFEIFVKAMLPSLSELKVLPSFCFAFKIPDDVVVTIMLRDQVFLSFETKRRMLVSVSLWFGQGGDKLKMGREWNIKSLQK